MSKELDVSKLLEEAIKNVRSDRGNAHAAVIDIMKHVFNDTMSHKELGQSFVKYNELAQRSNEQLISIARLLQKTNPEFSGLDEDDKKALFDAIQDAQNSPSEDITEDADI